MSILQHTSELRICFRRYGICGHTQCLLWRNSAEFASIQDAQRSVEWRNKLAQQIFGWRSRETEAIGMRFTVGVDMGSAMVTVAGVAAEFAHGVVRWPGATFISLLIQE